MNCWCSLDWLTWDSKGRGWVTEKGENTQADTQRPQSRQWRRRPPAGAAPHSRDTDPLLKRTPASKCVLYLSHCFLQYLKFALTEQLPGKKLAYLNDIASSLNIAGPRAGPSWVSLKCERGHVPRPPRSAQSSPALTSCHPPRPLAHRLAPWGVTVVVIGSWVAQGALTAPTQIRHARLRPSAGWQQGHCPISQLITPKKARWTLQK